MTKSAQARRAHPRFRHIAMLGSAFMALPHTAAYRFMRRIGLVLLAARVALLVALLTILMVDMLISRAHAAPTNGATANRQTTILAVLTNDDLPAVKGIRSGCVMGREPARIVEMRAAGLAIMPDAAEYCVAALTRLGRERQLGYVLDPSHDGLTPALAFDQGFVAAFLKGEKVPSDVPGMEALKTVAEGCLAQSEPRTDVCSAAGYVFGVRAYNGENITAR